ncbi:zinc finger protein 569-like [Eupeodes corollae]|uniref:zinc finger protein 569-like n=1 Tax=Eupeodes corollae TaxID=290404 RepID=UPI002492446F|nr:zinc finger protein 569-like [Eupeodes corollae]
MSFPFFRPKCWIFKPYLNVNACIFYILYSKSLYYTEIMDTNFANNSFLDKQCACRCCLAKNTELKPIFNSVGWISEAIFLFTSVKIDNDDNLPATICTTCLDDLNKCINFKRKVESTDFLLREWLARSSLQKVEVDHDYAKPIQNSVSKNFDCSHELRPNEEHNFKDSSRRSTADDLRCIQCGKKFTDKTTLENHEICHMQNSIPDESKFTCSTCRDVFAVAEDLFVHSSLHDDSNGFMCKSCNKTFLTFFKLKRHVPTHFHEKPYKCQLCEMRFVEMASLTRHFRVHTEAKSKSKTHLCLICKKTFPNRYTLKVHNRSHTGERPWKCDSCDKQFSDFRLLNSHKRIHDQSKPYECKKCRKSFRHRSTLMTHSRTHMSKNRPHRCDKCKKAFKQLCRLQLHKRRAHKTSTNISTLRFLCEQCCQIFTSNASLEDHLRWHSKNVEIHNENAPKEAPSEYFQCNDCSAQFSSRLDLITHQKLTHSLRHECDTCFGKWKTLEELVRHKCNEAMKALDEPSPDEMILLPNGQIQDCNTIVDTLLASVSQLPATTPSNEKETTKTKEL